MENSTTVREFILLGLTNNQQIAVGLFLILLGIYFLTLIGNMLIIIITLVNAQLCSPMYFFLRHVAWIEIGYISSIIPKTLANIATGNKSISLAGCFVQMFLHFVLGTTEFLLLATMSVDRYIAICNPLHYTTIMNEQICSLLVLCCWIGGLSLILVPAILFFQMPFCGPNNIINHFFCDNGALIKLSCVETSLLELINFVIATFSLLGTLSVNIVSYVKIISTILRIPSTTGRKKTFSTCASHMTVVSITYSSCVFIYIRPKGSSKLDYNKMMALLNTVLAPLLIPFIYCLRNRQVQDALRIELRQWIEFCKKLK
ncbi:olfactory receptor 49-like [Crotalus tigris]|uniref:olfactory receptor 49-like n=1 Tax=Crotalus tigris TaxID=88082 RepID=UPI00192F967C|nr:olfactory receptor 49-like [Crotalus tigris]XP_039185888.1 olfactory receptor 49-like [Crotalus tigris]XP_039185889.1 olfactory receptor 49-like [Crotalus tigris]XP_039185890.1 olfactory receptor 49-like [Crotalus tigris]